MLEKNPTNHVSGEGVGSNAGEASYYENFTIVLVRVIEWHRSSTG